MAIISFLLANPLHARSPLVQRARANLIVYHFSPSYNRQGRLRGHFHLSCTFNDRWLFRGRLCLLLLLSGSTERGAERLCPDTQSTRLLDDRLVYRQCWAVDLNDVLQEELLVQKGNMKRKEG